jgi:regulatory protein
VSPPGGWRRRSPRRTEIGADSFPGDAAPAQESDPEAVAREICLRLLSFAPRTRAQLADALRRRGVSDEVAGRVLGRYSEVGLIDDQAFARAWVQSRHIGRGLARRALAAELRQRGVAEETVDEAVRDLRPEQEEEAARELIARRLPATSGLDPARRMRRLMGMLARKGYSSGLSYRLVREALEAGGAGDLPEQTFDE